MERQVVFKLIERLKTSLKYAPVRFGFNLPVLLLLNGLAEASEEGRRICMSDISEALCITKSAVSQMIDRLSEQGLVERTPCPQNKKIIYIEPTDLAKQNFVSVKQKMSDFFQAISIEMGDDLDELIRLTDKFVNALENVMDKSDCNVDSLSDLS